MIKQLIFTLIYHIIVNRGENMVFFKGLAIKNYNDYSNKDTKLLRDIKDKKLFNVNISNEIMKKAYLTKEFKKSLL